MKNRTTELSPEQRQLRHGKYLGITAAINVAVEMEQDGGTLDVGAFVEYLSGCLLHDHEEDVYPDVQRTNPWFAYFLGIATGVVLLLTWIKWS